MKRLKAAGRKALAHFVKRFRYELIPASWTYDWQREGLEPNPPVSGSVPEEALEYLTQDNPRLLELADRYRRFDAAVTASEVWTDSRFGPADLRCFRGDHANYVWQVRSRREMNALAYALSAYYVRSIDRLQLLDRLEEDDLFGACTYEVGHRTVSRDLLDSIIEIEIIDRHLSISSSPDFRVLDIGAGYGRLAQRMVSGLDNLGSYLCTDAFARSTFVSEYYLRFRSAGPKARVVPVDEIESVLRSEPVNLAVNIHSFSECLAPAVEWWVGLLERHGVKHLFVVPNSHDPEQPLISNDGQELLPILERHGFRQVAQGPKYRDPVVQKYGLEPTYYQIFEAR